MKTNLFSTVAVGIMLTLSLTACGDATPTVKPAPKPAVTQSAPTSDPAPTSEPVVTPDIPQNEQFLLTDSTSITYKGVTVSCPDMNATAAVQLIIVNGDTANPVCEYPVTADDEMLDAINNAENG